MARVWSDVTVDEGSLRFHIGNLRKALGERWVSRRQIHHYCVGSRVLLRGPDCPGGESDANGKRGRAATNSHRLPPSLTRMVGRHDTIQELLSLLADRRFVTIVGPGEIGKTTVAVLLGHLLSANFNDAVFFFDLGPLSDPQLVPNAVASILGLYRVQRSVTGYPRIAPQ